jgi:thioredoxin-related protein
MRSQKGMTLQKETRPRLKRNILARAALLIGLVLAAASEINLCATSACTEAHSYSLFGVPFAVLGIVFFAAAWLVFEVSRFFAAFSILFLLMIFGAGGAEVAFILIQKYEIRQWCPLCLGVAGVVYFLAVMASLERVNGMLSKLRERKVTLMALGKKVLIILLVFLFGFGVAYRGAQKSEAEETVPNIFLGNKSSSLEVYIVTDWFCPACRQAEQEIEKTVAAIGKKAKIVFVDLPIHAESLNFTPYNLSFLVHEKERYPELRKALMALAQKTKEPSQEDVQKAISPLRVTYKPLAFLAVSRGMKFYGDVAKTFQVKSTPTVVIHNAKSKKSVLIVGSKDVAEANILKALSEVQRK